MRKRQLPRRPLRQRAYEFIQSKLLSGELGAGSLLSEPSLAREIGISRTPIREAIGRLQAEGLVEVLPQRGTAIRSINREELVELYELREALESFAARKAAERVRPEDLRELRELCGQMRAMASELRGSGQRALNAEQMRRHVTTDLGFHMVIIRAAGNRRIAKNVSDSRLLVRLLTLPRQAHDLHILAEAHRYHTRVLKALREHDGESASKVMAEHIRTAMRHTLDHYDRTRPSIATISVGLSRDAMQQIESAGGSQESGVAVAAG